MSNSNNDIEFIEKILDICDRFPENVNPKLISEEGLVVDMCAYTDVNDPNRHCLIGQYIAENYPDYVPGPYNRNGASNVLEGIDDFSDSLLTIASEIQSLADGQYFVFGEPYWESNDFIPDVPDEDGNNIPRKWGFVAQTIRENLKMLQR